MAASARVAGRHGDVRYRGGCPCVWRRHWPSDAAAALAIGGAYAALALLHPDPRWRLAATAFGAMLTGAGLLAAASGTKVPFPAGTAPSRATPILRLTFGDAQEQGALHGVWARGEPDPVRRTAWLRAPVGTVDLPEAPPSCRGPRGSPLAW